MKQFHAKSSLLSGKGAFSVVAGLCLLAPCLARADDTPLQQVRKYVSSHTSPDDVYVIVDQSVNPTVKYLEITHDRWLLNSIVSKTKESRLTNNNLSLAPGLQIHVIVVPKTKTMVPPATEVTYTFTNASSSSGQTGHSSQAKQGGTTPGSSTPMVTTTTPGTATTKPTKTTTQTVQTTSKGLVLGTEVDDKTGNMLTSGELDATPFDSNEGYEYTRADLLTPATGSLTVKLDDTDTLTITKAPSWDWSAAFSPTLVIAGGGGRPAYGVTTLAVPFGTNSNISFDTVGTFSADSTGGASKASATANSTSVNLGEALSYSTVIGSSYINSGRDTFGFAIQFKISLGLTMLNLSGHNFGKSPFIAIGFSIPFKTKS